MKRLYHGSCHCGAVRFTAQLDLASGTSRCNCSYCLKTRFWKTFCGADELVVTQGAETLADYRGPDSMWPEDHIHHRFCTTCGVQVFSRGYLEQLGGWFYAVSVGGLDDASDAELEGAPVRYEDGRADRQMEAPEVTGYL